MKKDNAELKKPSIDLLENIINEIEKPTSRKLEISKPEKSSPWIFRMLLILGSLLMITLATRVVGVSYNDTAINGTALLLLAIAGFSFSFAFKKIKKRKNL